MARVEGFSPQDVQRLQAEIVRVWYDQARPRIVQAMTAEAPEDTGALVRSHTVELPRRQGRDWVTRIVASVPYGRVVHQGHGVIRPARATVLRWVDKAGTVVFAKSVRPLAGNPWMVRAFRRLGFSRVLWLGQKVTTGSKGAARVT